MSYEIKLFRKGREMIVRQPSYDDLLVEVEMLSSKGWEWKAYGNITETNEQPRKKREPERPICLCPRHTNTDIRKDKSGGYYCGVKNNGKWCGCHFDEAGNVDREPYPGKKKVLDEGYDIDELGFNDD